MCPTRNLFRNNTELFQSSLSEPTARTCHKKYCPRIIPTNIGKYFGQSHLLAKLRSITVKEIAVKSWGHFPRRSGGAPWGISPKNSSFPCFLSSILHSGVLMIAFYYVFTNVLFTTHSSKYMAYEKKIADMGELFNANLSTRHALN